MSPKAVTQRCEQRRPSSCPAAVMPPSCMETPDGKGIAQQVGQRVPAASYEYCSIGKAQ